MMLWTIIIGATMGVSTIANIAQQASNKPHTENNEYNTTQRSNTNNYYSSNRSRGYLRLSPFPARSAVMFPL